jgi:hypothetical protein
MVDMFRSLALPVDWHIVLLANIPCWRIISESRQKTTQQIRESAHGWLHLIYRIPTPLPET